MDEKLFLTTIAALLPLTREFRFIETTISSLEADWGLQIIEEIFIAYISNIIYI